MTQAKKAELANIKRAFEEKYENNLPQNVKEELAIITYNLTKKLESHPELIETRLAMALPILPPPLIGLNGQPMSYSEVGAALLQSYSPKDYSTNIIENAFLNKDITPFLIILDKLGLLEKAISLCFQGLGSDDIIERSKPGNKSNKPPAASANNTGSVASLPGGDPNDDDPFAQFTKKEGTDFYECEQSESPVWKELRFYRKIEGKATKTNGLTGKNLRYYQWDNLHKEIEMYDRHGKPLDALDPVNGKLKGKDVAGHQPLKLN